VNSRLQNVKVQYQYLNWKVPKPDLLDLVAIFICWSIRISGVSASC